ncbi:hypothetical protein NDU88_001565 [Pleurodeles waltl]|uniref:Uncharacterized protein n=1 Tax=Pleurodeles waltl TaxID=8319 RepID=A0AAV7NDR4_PLEWA|nr:hypothetical protein NDU88_001565 [Pleurodeles waltl]
MSGAEESFHQISGSDKPRQWLHTCEGLVNTSLPTERAFVSQRSSRQRQSQVWELRRQAADILTISSCHPPISCKTRRETPESSVHGVRHGPERELDSGRSQLVGSDWNTPPSRKHKRRSGDA